MAVSWRTEGVSVVGFCGLPVHGACGLASPLFEDASGQCFVGDPDASTPPSELMNAARVRDEREAGFLTLTETKRARIVGGVFLYVHSAFAAPLGALEFDIAPLVMDDRAGVYVAYMSRPEALHLLHQWGASLLRDARSHLDNREPDRATDCAQRALFCSPPPEHQELRFDAFVCLYAAIRRRGADGERLLKEASLDFNRVQVSQIRRRGELHAQMRGVLRPSGAQSPDPADRRMIAVGLRRVA